MSTIKPYLSQFSTEFSTRDTNSQGQVSRADKIFLQVDYCQDRITSQSQFYLSEMNKNLRSSSNCNATTRHFFEGGGDKLQKFSEIYVVPAIAMRWLIWIRQLQI